MKRYYLFIVILFVFSGLAVVAQFATSRGPTADNQTATDLADLQNGADEYALDHQALPTSIDQIQVKNPSRGFNDRLKNYAYQKTAFDTYQVCGTFKTDNTSRYRGYSSSDYQTPTIHHQGYQCFSRKSYIVPTPVNNSTSHPVIINQGTK